MKHAVFIPHFTQAEVLRLPSCTTNVNAIGFVDFATECEFRDSLAQMTARSCA
jgi:hypothetical protein